MKMKCEPQKEVKGLCAQSSEPTQTQNTGCELPHFPDDASVESCQLWEMVLGSEYTETEAFELKLEHC